MIIGLTGLAGVGKSEVAHYLVQSRGFRRTAFADPLKEMLLALGFTRNQLYGTEKGVVDQRFGKSPREIMQLAGTEFMRNMVHQDAWVRLWEERITHSEAMHRHVVVEDVRFVNEADAIRAKGGFIWEIHRPGVERMGHASENQEIAPSYIIHNDAGLWDLQAKTLTAVSDMAYQPPECAVAL